MMDRKRLTIAAGVAVVIGVAAIVLMGAERRAALARSRPAWLDPQQPSEGIAADLRTVSDAESWAANRCRPMAASCSGYTAGRRIRRTYPGSLADAPYSFIRASVDLQGGI